MSRKETRQLNKVKEQVSAQNFSKALSLLIPIYKTYPDCAEVQYLHGLINYRFKDYSKAITSFHRVYEIDPDYEATLSYTLGKLYMDNKEYDKAIPPLQYFIERYPDNEFTAYADRYLKLSQNRLQILSDSLINFNPIRLPPEINTAKHEYFPALSVDDKSLIFTRRIGGQEDIYISTMDSAGRWTKAVPMPGVNTPDGNEGGHCISADGKVFIFTACRKRDSYGSCDLFISYKAQDGSWTTPRNMGLEVNSKAWDAQPSLSPDKRTLYFASTRAGGKSHIYTATLQDNGAYRNVQVIGEPINSPGNEWSPFIAYDNETLYFSSDGHPGLGGRDLFISRKDSTGNWSSPINLGPPLNSEADEGTIYINATASKGYISSDLHGSLDIYSFTPDKSISPQAVTYIEGYVYDSTTLDKLVANVSVLRLRDSTLVSELTTNSDGYYLSCLPIGEEYAFWVEKPGYLFHSSRHFIKDTLALVNPLRIDIPLLAIDNLKPNTIIRLENILYPTGSSDLLPIAFPELNKLYDFLEKNKKVKIHIMGHTDDVGAAEDNQILSENRARSVMNYLLKRGIDEKRMTSEGFGETQPLVPNDSSENRALNRRTEVHILVD